MDFFARQDHARRLTKRLVVMFILAVISVVVVMNVAAGWSFQQWANQEHIAGDVGMMRLKLHAVVTAVVLGVITLGSLWKISELSAGGPAVAAMMGARPVDRNTLQPAERQLVNVVEEMSIASGVPMPQVFVMDEAGINAFAAGFGTADAVVAVTRGCLERLSRDELQGVIAHEFSHILNGDMRINLRLIGLLHGLLVIALVGQFLFRIAATSRSSNSRDNKGNGAVPLLVMGLVMVVLGYVGYFFGQLIKAAISRQREFLADASAVQFTRNPSGIAGALKKIGGFYEHAFVQTPRASEASHLFLGRAVTAPAFGWLDTHPPLPERILAIDPQWKGGFDEDRSAPDERPAAAPPVAAQRAPALASSFSLSGTNAQWSPATVAERVGTVAPQHVSFGAELMASLPPLLVEAARDPFASRAVVMAMMVGADPARIVPAFDLIARVDLPLYREVRRLHPAVIALGDGARLPLIDLATPTLRQLSLNQVQDFLNAITVLERTGGTSVAMHVLAMLVRARVAQPVGRRGNTGLAALREPIAVLLSTLAHAGSNDEAEQRSAYTLAVGRLGIPDAAFISASALDVGALDASMQALAQAKSDVARGLVEACAWCVAADGRVTVREAELLRAVTACLGCPMPPFADLAAAA